MAELTVDLTYGNALYSAAADLGMKESILREGEQLVGILKKEPVFDAFLKDPVVSVAEKKTTLKNIFEGKISKELLNFMYILVDKGRAGRFAGIIREYRKLADKEEGVAYGTIVSAMPLKEEQIKKFEKQTAELMQVRVSLKNDTDESLIGGVRILVNGHIIDTSLKKRLEEMADSFNL